MAGIEEIEYEGHRIIYVDYRGLDEEECIQLIKDYTKKVTEENKMHLCLANVTKIYATPDYMKQAYEMGRVTRHLMKKVAVVGITGVKFVLLQSLNKVMGEPGLVPFNNEEEAKEWLIKD